MADYINKIRTTEGDKPVNYEALANKPNSLPNPNKIKFTGSVVAEYDGSSEVTVNIPNGASEEQAAQIQTNTNDISELKNKTSELKGDLSAKITAPSSANVGQTIVVKKIDDEGKPTEWEMASLPSLDINAYELLLETTIEEEASVHEFYLPKSCRDLLMFVKLGAGGVQGDIRFTVFDDFFVTVREPYFYLHIISLGDSVKRVDFFAQSEIQLMYGSSVSTRFIKLRNPQKSTNFVRSYNSFGVGAEVKIWGR